jgi:cell division protein FtsB
VKVRYWLGLIILGGAVLYYAQARDLQGRLVHHQERQQQVETLRGQLQDKEQQKTALERRVHGLKSDPVEIEAAIREAEQKVREGETIYRIERVNSTSDVAPRKAP